MSFIPTEAIGYHYKFEKSTDPDINIFSDKETSILVVLSVYRHYNSTDTEGLGILDKLFRKCARFRPELEQSASLIEAYKQQIRARTIVLKQALDTLFTLEDFCNYGF